jgi:environmental stress-induced protein Ves
MTRQRLLSPADYRRMAWKNGGGRTTEILSHPSGAALDEFAWRVSVADIAKDGPFSKFAGVDRTIVMIGGSGMRLEGSGHAALLATPFEPYAFSGDDAIDCTLVAGAVRDFNLMLRRGRASGDVVVARDAGTSIAPARFRLSYAAAGAHECLYAGHPPIHVAADHALLIETDASEALPLAIHPLGANAVALVARVDITG